MLFLAALLACGGGDDDAPKKVLTPIPGTTHRIATPAPVGNLDLDLKIMANETDCDVVRSEMEAICMPHIDRQAGEVRLSFQLRVDGEVYPMPLTASKKYDVEVGRMRKNDVFGDNGLDFFVVGDQLLRGAALNAVLIAEAVM